MNLKDFLKTSLDRRGVTLRYFLLSNFILTICFSSKPEDRKAYQIPKVFQIEKRIIYGENEAEVYLSLKPRFSVENVALSLVSSHPESLKIQSANKTITQTGLDLTFLQLHPQRLLYKVVRSSSFSLASVTFRLRFTFPRDEILKWVQEHTEIYKDRMKRQELLRKISKRESIAEEVEGVFFYGRR
ncbi:hypothetical protein HOF92_17215, partial [bacterium]|nr:hypothetical protein [bacterium]